MTSPSSSAPGVPASTARRVHLRTVERGRHANLTEVSRHRERQDALHRLRTFAAVRPVEPVFSHWSALLIHGLPTIGRLPGLIHVLARGEIERADHGIVQHARRGTPDVVTVRGLRVTSVARTVADLSGRTSLVDGVIAADAALSRGPFGAKQALTSRREMEAAAESLTVQERRLRALAVIRFADGRAESPLESASRVSMALVGAPPPLLQTPIEDLLGFRARLDFAWPEFALAGESDGAVKYLLPSHTRGRQAVTVFSEQQRRERLISGQGLRVFRWGWDVGTRPDRMASLLRDVGLPLGRRCTMEGIDQPSISAGGAPGGATGFRRS